MINKQDHAAAPRWLREALGNALPERQEKFYRRLLGRKDEVNYGARSTSLDEAQRLLLELDAFAEWAENASQHASVPALGGIAAHVGNVTGARS